MKLVLALFGLMLAIAAVAGLVFLRGDAGACEDRALDEARSPDGRVGAQAYERRCGDERTLRVKLWLVGNPRTPSDVWAAVGVAAPRVRFTDARSVVVEEPAGTRRLLLESAWRDVNVSARAAGSPP